MNIILLLIFTETLPVNYGVFGSVSAILLALIAH